MSLSQNVLRRVSLRMLDRRFPESYPHDGFVRMKRANLKTIRANPSINKSTPVAERNLIPLTLLLFARRT